jgi:hypothetical protein
MTNIVAELQKINAFESQLTRIDLSEKNGLNVRLNGKVDFQIDNIAFHAPLNRPTIHQLGSRLWDEEKGDYGSIIEKWDQQYRSNKQVLAENIANRLKEKSSVLLVAEQTNRLYGIISDQFTHIDPLTFRDRFIEAYSSIGMPLKNQDNVSKTPFGELIENYSFNETSLREVNEPIQYTLKVIYGLNNGYSSFRVKLGRLILVCKNGLTEFEGIKSAKLKHTKDADVSLFANSVKDEVLAYNTRLQVNIKKAKDQRIISDQVNELFQRLHVATVVKNRIRERFDIEMENSGRNEWALSQAFTHVGTHFYKTGNDKHHERILTEVGSEVLDNNVEGLLKSEIKRIFFGALQTYGNLLPKVEDT